MSSRSNTGAINLIAAAHAAVVLVSGSLILAAAQADFEAAAEERTQRIVGAIEDAACRPEGVE